MIRVYYGKSASGKDTMAKKCVEYGYKPIISYTTRPMRPGEVDGKDYHFVSDVEFDKLQENGLLLESRVYNVVVNGNPGVWKYGSPIVDPLAANYVAVTEINGLRAYIEHYGAENILPVYLYVPSDEERHRRYINRGGEEAEWKRRFIADEEDFSEENLRRIYLLSGGRVIEEEN